MGDRVSVIREALQRAMDYLGNPVRQKLLPSAARPTTADIRAHALERLRQSAQEVGPPNFASGVEHGIEEWPRIMSQIHSVQPGGKRVLNVEPLDELYADLQGSFGLLRTGPGIENLTPDDIARTVAEQVAKALRFSSRVRGSHPTDFLRPDKTFDVEPFVESGRRAVVASAPVTPTISTAPVTRTPVPIAEGAVKIEGGPRLVKGAKKPTEAATQPGIEQLERAVGEVTQPKKPLIQSSEAVARTKRRIQENKQRNKHYTKEQLEAAYATAEGNVVKAADSLGMTPISYYRQSVHQGFNIPNPLEKTSIEKALKVANFNPQKAAEHLGVELTTFLSAAARYGFKFN